jgi:hypothetical protein
MSLPKNEAAAGLTENNNPPEIGGNQPADPALIGIRRVTSPTPRNVIRCVKPQAPPAWGFFFGGAPGKPPRPAHLKARMIQSENRLPPFGIMR